MGKTRDTGFLGNCLLTDSSNNVGIGGAANASFKLQVTGATNLTGALSGTSATFSQDIASLFGIASVRNGSNTQGSGPYFLLSNAASNQLWYQQLNASNGLDFWYNGSIKMNITSGGLLGIGTGTSVSAYGFFGVAGSVTISSLTGVVAGFSDAVNGTTRLYVKSGVNGINVDQSFEISTGGGSPTPRMTITSGGNVGIGTSTIGSDFKLAVYGSNSLMAFQNANTGQGNGDGFIVGSFGNVDAYLYNYENANIIMGTNATERMRITSGGQLLINTTTSNPDANLRLQVNGIIASLGTANSLMFQNRTSTNTYEWYATSGTIYIYSSAGSANILSINGSNGTYTALSDVNKKKDFEDSTIGLNAILNLKPTLYRMKSDETEGSKELGFIAQEIKEFIPQAYVESGEDENKFIGLNYNAIVAALVKSVQELTQKVNALENK
jgi:hypothetical protein